MGILRLYKSLQNNFPDILTPWSFEKKLKYKYLGVILDQALNNEKFLLNQLRTALELFN